VDPTTGEVGFYVNPEAIEKLKINADTH